MKNWLRILFVISWASFGFAQDPFKPIQDDFAQNLGVGSTWIVEARKPRAFSSETFSLAATTKPILLPSGNLYMEAKAGKLKAAIFIFRNGRGFYSVIFRNSKVILSPHADEGDEQAVYCYVIGAPPKAKAFSGYTFFGTGRQIGGIVDPWEVSTNRKKYGTCKVNLS
jgi:hypothetical protein